VSKTLGDAEPSTRDRKWREFEQMTPAAGRSRKLFAHCPKPRG
jgi:hypothetical protein